ncbi:MAG: BlaI/MecI/CopY family transcriptional regulator [candidate division Zixibacteria bacterium]|nr:BlaI/MecI/CopY family transcriptional regulator [candidate division Zixibacteria bacterium]
MTKGLIQKLTRRERQIMDIVYKDHRATAAEIHSQLPDRPSYSSVRALLRILEEKRFLKHSTDGRRYVYRPAIAPERAKMSALKHMLNTFFDGSVGGMVATLMDMSNSELSDDEYAQLQDAIDRARKARS